MIGLSSRSSAEVNIFMLLPKNSFYLSFDYIFAGFIIKVDLKKMPALFEMD